jgi:triacylglycerol esterase/lipase EstA (alpha/beta hydrolase family)
LQISIVAVHGLNPTNKQLHAEHTWTLGDKLWLRDFLPSKLPHARVLLFGYNSNIAFETSIAGVREQAANLLNRLSHKRGNAESRPIIFVAHSLGGIIIKRALVEAKLDGTYEKILEATYGMAFFGTPHQGSTFAKLGDVVVSVVRSVLHNPKNTFMDSLKKSSLFSDTIVDDFRHQVEKYQILSFYETQKTKNLGIVGTYARYLLDTNLFRLWTRNLELLVFLATGRDRLLWKLTTTTSASLQAQKVMIMSKFHPTLYGL